LEKKLLKIENEIPPYFWIFTCTAFLALLLLGFFYKPNVDGQYIRSLLDGFKNLTQTQMAVAGLVIGIGSVLSTDNTIDSLKLCARACLLLAAMFSLLIALSFALPILTAVPKEIPDTIKELGIKPVEHRYALTWLVGFVLTIGSFGFILFALLSAAAATSITGNLIINALNGLPLPWQKTGPQSSNELAAGAIIVLFAVWSYVIPAFQSAFFTYDPAAEAKHAIASLNKRDDRFPDGPVLNYEKGRSYVEARIKTFERTFKKARDGVCHSRSVLDQELARYFQTIVEFEDWDIGRKLSPQSQKMADYLQQNLELKYVSWAKLPLYVQVHSDKQKYGAVVEKNCVEGKP
jgi:hypothetical protein